MRIDVFTLVPTAFAWMTEQRPLAAILGTELELRLFSYRDFTPLRAGQVDDEPYGGGAGMVLRVDVVDAALQAVYGGRQPRRVIALSPQGRLLDQQVVEELAAEDELTLLSARFEGFDERILEHVATDAVSIGPYVLSGGELPAMVLLDALARRLPGAIREESAARQAIARRILQGLEFQAHPEGHHLWLTLPERWRRADLNVYARQSGLALVPSEAFAVGLAPEAIRVSLGAAQNQAVLERGLGLLATVLSHGPSALSSIV